MKVYAIRFKNGCWSQGGSYQSTPHLDRAKFYANVGTARRAISYHKNSYCWQEGEPEIVEFDLIDVLNPDYVSIRLFYGAEDTDALIKTMLRHIESLQAELQKYKPKVIPVQFVRG